MSTGDSEKREANKQTLHRLLASISALDADGLRDQLHDSVVFTLPYDSTIPDCDRDGVVQLLSKMFVIFKKFELTITEVYDNLDPDLLIAQYQGDCVGRVKPVLYKNEYIGVFRFVDGKVANWREYANPEIAHAAFAEFAAD
jgi:ketosteroid isomerase-like protein